MTKKNATTTQCLGPECNRVARSKGLCAAHYQQAFHGKPLTVLRFRYRRGEAPTVCLFDGCGRDAKTLGYCSGHYNQRWKGQPMKPLRQFNPVRDGRKVCPRCGRDLPVAAYHKKLARITNECRECTSLRNRSRIYGLSVDEVRRLIATRRCEACGTTDFGAKGKAIDHCHTSGTVGGVLCSTCNLVAGAMDDDPGRLRALADYLERVRPHLRSA